ncbi:MULTISPECIES: hypothetical protein [Niastella]|uniref:Uncharacterized protein n=1 Tax=Niastella soli TaxID=2821487 RepID=A0ABS3YV36_9BACT|nr:hypothetical protein [Niastella soli]MBO9201738.1 hypothetical protein [Niastella soli]
MKTRIGSLNKRRADGKRQTADGKRAAFSATALRRAKEKAIINKTLVDLINSFVQN